MTRKHLEIQESGRFSSESKKSMADDNNNNNNENKQFYVECKATYEASKILVSNLKRILSQVKGSGLMDENFVAGFESLSAIIEGMRKISVFKTANANKEVEGHRIALWKYRLYVEKLAIWKLSNDLVTQLLDSPSVESVLRLAHLCNEMAPVNLCGDLRSINVFTNTCPMLLHPLRKLTVTRILQILAAKRAETCSHRLIFGVLNCYFEAEEESALETLPVAEKENHTKTNETEDTKGNIQGTETVNCPDPKLLRTQNSVSSNTSVEIYRALTKHLESRAREPDASGSESIEGLRRNEEKRGRAFLALLARISPQLLGSNWTTLSKTSGCPRLKSSLRKKLNDFYQQMLWGEVGGYLEHILLWWSPDPLGSFPPTLCQNLKDFLVELKATDFFPLLLMPSVNSLLDAMTCHLTSTSWDLLFRKTLVSAGQVKRDVYRGYGIEGSATGQLFVEMLADLIKLNNSCENPNANLEDLPLVEQIPILHRLDHSVHTVRLWSSNRCRNLASKWNLDEFYCTCHADITKCLQILATLQLMDREKQIPAATSVQVTVCVKMRAKLSSEIRDNMDKLKITAGECIDVLAKNCRTECLAFLHMTFPHFSYWKQDGPLPECASDYVEKYLDRILRPVFAATHEMSAHIQQSSSAMVLRILCESWLEYVYLHRIKFSEWGAVQLLTDFGAIPTWLLERVQLPRELLNFLSSHEVLRRCEGVGRLLLRRRGESIRMSGPQAHRSGGEEIPADTMPAEMYVPNQEQWLELRAPLKTNICCQL